MSGIVLSELDLLSVITAAMHGTSSSLDGMFVAVEAVAAHASTTGSAPASADTSASPTAPLPLFLAGIDDDQNVISEAELQQAVAVAPMQASYDVVLGDQVVRVTYYATPAFGARYKSFTPTGIVLVMVMLTLVVVGVCAVLISWERLKMRLLRAHEAAARAEQHKIRQATRAAQDATLGYGEHD